MTEYENYTPDEQSGYWKRRLNRARIVCLASTIGLLTVLAFAWAEAWPWNLFTLIVVFALWMWSAFKMLADSKLAARHPDVSTLTLKERKAILKSLDVQKAEVRRFMDYYRPYQAEEILQKIERARETVKQANEADSGKGLQ